MLAFLREIQISQICIRFLLRRHVNILQAYITPANDGYMFAIIMGETNDIKNAMEYLDKEKVNVISPQKNLVFHEEKCTHCGACIAHCNSEALILKDNFEVFFDSQKCIGCETCISSCSYGVLESIKTTLKKNIHKKKIPS